LRVLLSTAGSGEVPPGDSAYLSSAIGLPSRHQYPLTRRCCRLTFPSFAVSDSLDKIVQREKNLVVIRIDGAITDFLFGFVKRRLMY
jgi:hypothetical protein